MVDRDAQDIKGTFPEEGIVMTKRQLIDEIVSINRSAEAGFLAEFSDGELVEYLDSLRGTYKPVQTVTKPPKRQTNLFSAGDQNATASITPERSSILS